jgi:hypothetical protein
MKINIQLNHFPFIVLIQSACLFLINCTSDKMLIKANYQNPEYKKMDLIRERVKVVKVFDKRYSMPNIKNVKDTDKRIGTFNKVIPYILEEPVTKFVEKSVNEILSHDNHKNEIIPITIIIDTFKVYEKAGFARNELGVFKASLNFTYPITADSVGLVSTFTIQEGDLGVDIRDKVENQIYKGIRHCTEQFISYYDKTTKYIIHSDSIPVQYTEEKVIPKEIKNDAYKKITSEKESNTSLNFTYYSGEKINGGFGINYNTFFYIKDNLFVNGFGYGMCYYDIKQHDNIANGSFFTFKGKYIPRLFFSESKEGFYLTGGISLTFGTEKIGNKTNFFIGPTFEEALGLKLGPILLEAGFFELAHFGSDILPSDIGFIAGFGVQL